MRITKAATLVVLPAMLALQACFGTGADSPEQPLPLLGLSPDSPAQAGSPRVSPEEARAQAVAEIRAKSQAYAAQHDSAPYPPVFAAQGPPLAIATEPKTQEEIETELSRVRSELQEAADPDERSELEARMAELVELGRSHEGQSEQRIRAISEQRE